MYASIVEAIFRSKYKPGMREVDFERQDIERFAKKLRIKLPRNPGDLVYSFRYRAALPESIRIKAGKDATWIIRGVGRSKLSIRCCSRSTGSS